MKVDMDNTGERCETCRFSAISSAPSYVWCRRFPPVWTGGDDDSDRYWGMPHLPGAAWCGEWRPLTAEEADRRRKAQRSGLSNPDAAQDHAEAALAERLLPYTNHRGEFAIRRISPIRVWFGSTEWHPEPQWLLRALDLDKDAERDFAIKDIGVLATQELAAMKALTAEDLAEALECFWNAAIGEAHQQQEGMATASIMATGLSAVALRLRELSACATSETVESYADVPDYDAGLLNDHGGGNVDWWQDYIRAEVSRANEYWRSVTAEKAGSMKGAGK